MQQSLEGMLRQLRRVVRELAVAPYAASAAAVEQLSQQLAAVPIEALVQQRVPALLCGLAMLVLSRQERPAPGGTTAPTSPATLYKELQMLNDLLHSVFRNG